jgi:hypothetical protein
MEEKGLKEGMKRFKDALKLRDQDDPIFQYGELPCNVAGKGNFTRWNSPLSAFSGCDGDEPVFVDKIVRLCSSFDGQLSFAVELEALHEAFDFEELHRHFLYCQHLAELCARPEVLMGSETGNDKHRVGIFVGQRVCGTCFRAQQKVAALAEQVVFVDHVQQFVKRIETKCNCESKNTS